MDRRGLVQRFDEADVTARLRWLAAGRPPPAGLTLRFEGETSALAGALERAVDGRVRLEAPVVGVEDEGHEVVVRFHDGTIERAGRVVLAVPLTLQSEISFEPVGSRAPAAPPRRAIYGQVVKEGALRDAQAVPRRTSRQTVTCTARLTTRGSSSASPGPERPRGTSRSRSSRRRGTGGPGRRRLGARGVDRGAIILGPGQLLDWGGRLGEPHGRVHFAGVERAALRSYMEGAARAGEDVAAEILAARL